MPLVKRSISIPYQIKYWFQTRLAWPLTLPKTTFGLRAFCVTLEWSHWHSILDKLQIAWLIPAKQCSQVQQTACKILNTKLTSKYQRTKLIWNSLSASSIGLWGIKINSTEEGFFCFLGHWLHLHGNQCHWKQWVRVNVVFWGGGGMNMKKLSLCKNINTHAFARVRTNCILLVLKHLKCHIAYSLSQR